MARRGGSLRLLGRGFAVPNAGCGLLRVSRGQSRGLGRCPDGPLGLCAGSVVKGRLPQLGEKVLVKAAYNPGQAVPWNAVKVQTLSNQVPVSPWHLRWRGVGSPQALRP